MAVRQHYQPNRQDRPRVSLWTNVVMLTIAVGFAAGYRLGSVSDELPQQARVTKPVSTRVYPVHDILANSKDGQRDLTAIVSHIHRAIEPSSWQSSDRLLLAYAQQQSIVVKQTHEVHLQISSFLDHLRAQQTGAQRMGTRWRNVREVLNPIRFNWHGRDIVC